MKDIIKQIYNESNDIWGDSQEYKGIKFYPLKLKDSEYIKLFYKLFLYPKNHIPERRIVKESYLKFLLFEVNPEQDFEKTVKIIIDFLKFVTKSKNIIFDYWNNEAIEDPLFALNIKLIIDGTEFFETDFDNIREILLEQNGTWIEYIEEYNPDLEVSLRFINKSTLDLDLKDEIFTFAALLKVPINQLEIKDMTLYQLKNEIEILMRIKDYDLIKPLEVSGQIKAKNGGEIIKHYFSHIYKAGRYSSILLNKDEFMKNNGMPDPDKK
jgi:hypothetical protein